MTDQELIIYAQTCFEVVKPYLGETVKIFAEKVIEKPIEHLYEKFISLFSSKREKEVLQEVIIEPENEVVKQEVQKIVAEKLKQDAQLLEDIKVLLGKVGETREQRQINQYGEKSMYIEKNDGTINIS